jgi:ATP-dependent DNA helicase Rep
MRERVAKRIKGDAAKELTVSTFHALGLKILQIEHAKLGLRAGSRSSTPTTAARRSRT